MSSCAFGLVVVELINQDLSLKDQKRTILFLVLVVYRYRLTLRQLSKFGAEFQL